MTDFHSTCPIVLSYFYPMLFLIDIPRRRAVVPSIVFESPEKIKRLYTVDLDKKNWTSSLVFFYLLPLLRTAVWIFKIGVDSDTRQRWQRTHPRRDVRIVRAVTRRRAWIICWLGFRRRHVMTDGQARFHVNVDYRPSIVAPSGEKVADGANWSSKYAWQRLILMGCRCLHRPANF